MARTWTASGRSDHNKTKSMTAAVANARKMLKDDSCPSKYSSRELAKRLKIGAFSVRKVLKEDVRAKPLSLLRRRKCLLHAS